MISFKSFVEAVHSAIIEASNTLMDKNVGLLDKYFEETSTVVQSEGSDPVTKSTLAPKNVILEYPLLTADGKVETTEIQVPLITMVPLSMSQIEKATLTADFELEIVDGELQLSFPVRKNDKLFHKKSKSTTGKLEIVISPQESSEGLKLIVEGYEAVLKRQLS
jgi:hypothetical protein